ncbi:MAG: type II secretion system protein M [Pseudomonadales bacterium]|nr:type II secretion system protein M [Pseudomonadales bacterium]
MSLISSVGTWFENSAAHRWYLGREPGERPLILAVLTALILVLAWSLLWKPISDWRDLEANRYQNAQELWDFMQANEAAARARGSQASGAGSQRSLLPVITRTANVQGLRLNRIQPEADGAVSVVIQAQAFNTVLSWLGALLENNSVSVQRISVDAEGQPGIVNAQIRLL